VNKVQSETIGKNIMIAVRTQSAAKNGITPFECHAELCISHALVLIRIRQQGNAT